jgi:hypothetical protein
MKKDKNQAEHKPRYQYFYEIIHDAIEALNNINVISIPTTGVKSLFNELKKRKIKLTYGSLRLDRDEAGNVFLKEFRPRRILPVTGYFYNVKPVYPFWESIGSALIRLSEKKNREKSIKERNKQNILSRILKILKGKGKEYCLILQGNMEQEYVKILLEQGRITYNTQESHLQEEPIFSALAVLTRLPQEQILETKLSNKHDINNELVDELKKFGKSIQEIACIVGKKDDEEYYCALNENENHFKVSTYNHKLFPFEFAKRIIISGRSLMNGHRLLILDSISFDTLLKFLENFDQYYLKLS